MSPSPTLIAQVTDLHLRAGRALAYRKVDTAGALEICVAHLNAMTPRPDLVIFTGDMGDKGINEEYAILSDILAALTIPFVIVPGNHDRRRPLHEAFPAQAPLNEDGFIQFTVEDLPIRLIGLDTLSEGKPFGVLCERRLDWLETTLAEDPDRPTALFLHHPPFLTGIGHMDEQHLSVGKDRLATLIRATPGVRALLCGHLHRPIHTLWAGIVASCAPSPAHQVALDLTEDGPPHFILEPPGLHLHRWTQEGGLLTHLGVIGDYGPSSSFFDASGQLIS